jgi:hypothetical protein
MIFNKFTRVAMQAYNAYKSRSTGNKYINPACEFVCVHRPRRICAAV